jgi:hypothetical protein
MDQEQLPDLSTYQFDRVVHDAPVWDVEVPGLDATFWQREHGRCTATAGLYSYRGVPVFLACGYADERHCRYHTFRTADGRWEQPRAGCPRVRTQRDGPTVTGLLLRTRSGPGHCRASRRPLSPCPRRPARLRYGPTGAPPR